MNPTIVAALIYLSVVGMAILFCTKHPSTDESASPQRLTLLSVIVGSLSGFAVGLFLSPLNKAEGDVFYGVASTISVAVSGYLIAKLDPLITRGLKDPLTPLTVQRALLFASSFMTTSLVVFYAREYLLPRAE